MYPTFNEALKGEPIDGQRVIQRQLYKVQTDQRTVIFVEIVGTCLPVHMPF